MLAARPLVIVFLISVRRVEMRVSEGQEATAFRYDAHSFIVPDIRIRIRARLQRAVQTNRGSTTSWGDFRTEIRRVSRLS